MTPGGGAFSVYSIPPEKMRETKHHLNMTRCGWFCTAQVRNGAKTVAKVKRTAPKARGQDKIRERPLGKYKKQDIAQNVSSGILFCYDEIRFVCGLRLHWLPETGRAKSAVINGEGGQAVEVQPGNVAVQVFIVSLGSNHGAVVSTVFQFR